MRETKFKTPGFQEAGFTLIELMIASVISIVVVMAIGSVYSSQVKSEATQRQIIDMQQNLRAAMLIISQDLKKIGFDPYGNSAGVKINTPATGELINFTYIADSDGEDNDDDCVDEDSDGDCDGDCDDNADCDEKGETNTIIFDLSDSDADTVMDDLGRTSNNKKASIASNIERAEFIGLDINGNMTANVNEIRSIQISLLARSEGEDSGIVTARTYTTPAGTVWSSKDGHRRQLLTSTVVCRNMGFK